MVSVSSALSTSAANMNEQRPHEQCIKPNRPNLDGAIDLSKAKVVETKKLLISDVFITFGKLIADEVNMTMLQAQFTADDKAAFNNACRMMVRGCTIMGVDLMGDTATTTTSEAT